MTHVMRLLDWLFRTEASTRSSGLIRLFLSCVVWATFGRFTFLHLDLTPLGILRSVAFNVAATMMLFGVLSNASTFATALCCLSFVHLDGVEGGDAHWVHHNTRLLATAALLCAFLPCGRSYSLDRYVAVRRAERRGQAPPPERGNVWALRLLALQVSAVYFYGAFNKTTLGFLSGARMEHYAMWFFFGSSYPTWPGFHASMVALAWSTVVFEYALCVGLFFRRGRRLLVLPALVMHGLFYWWLNVATFTATMWTLYLAFFEPEEVHATIDRLSGHTRHQRSA